jgi:hypothetical protein
MPRHAASADRRRRSLRIRALLAGCIVLGVGTTLSLAAWTDTEYATAGFASSIFDTQSSSAGSPTYASNATEPGASMTFGATAMSPGAVHYAWLNIRTTPATTVGGVVTLDSVDDDAGGLVGALEYRAVRMTGPSPETPCGAATFSGTPAFIAGGASSYLPVTAVPIEEAVMNPIGAGGAALGFCFEVRVAPGAPSSYQGTSATVTWRFGTMSSS